MSAAAMANCAAGSSGVGPGVKRRALRITKDHLHEDLIELSVLCNHRIHNFVINVTCTKSDFLFKTRLELFFLSTFRHFSPVFWALLIPGIHTRQGRPKVKEFLLLKNRGLSL